MLKERIITSIILIPIVVYIIFLFPITLFILIITLICVLNALEWGFILKLNCREYFIWIVVTILFLLNILIIHLSSYQLINNIYRISYLLWISCLWWLIISPLLIINYIFSSKSWCKNKFFNLIFGLVIILPFFYSIVEMRNWYANDNCYIGSWLIFYIIVMVCSLDSGAYIFGNLLGRHKLVPLISPNKTWEGLLGGISTTAVISYIFIKYVMPFNVDLFKLCFCSVFTIISAIFGDLMESIFKREAGIKDSGYFIPGHGGILDLMDSLLAAVPTFCFFNLLINLC